MRISRRTVCTTAFMPLTAACGSLLPMARCEDMRLSERLAGADLILVHDNRTDQREENAAEVISAHDRIEPIQAFIAERPDHWFAPIEGVPIGRVRVVFWRGETRVGDLGLGQGFLVAQGCGYFFIRNISKRETETFADLIGWSSPMTF